MIENIINSPGTITGTQSVCFNGQPTQLSNATTATTLSGSATIHINGKVLQLLILVQV